MRALLTALAAALAFAAPASAASPNLVVSQVYGGGGNTGAPYTHDFIELFNRGSSDVTLGGKSLQYASATGTGNLGANAGQLSELPAVTLAPGQYFLVQEGAGAGNGVPLVADHVDPTPISMAAGAGKVVVAEGATTLGCNGASAPCTAEQLARIIDLVGYGNANFFEGAAAAPTLDNASSASRAAGGCQDSDNNGADFAGGTPAPRNAASVRNRCLTDTAPFVSETSPSAGATQVALNSSVSVTFSEPVDLAPGALTVQCTASGAHAGTVSGGPTTYTFDPATDFVRNEECTVTVSAAGVSDQDADDPPDNMAADFTSSFGTLGLALRIHDIQGAQHLSPHDGDFVSAVPGVITAKGADGFWFQDPQPDGSEATSEGVFVFTGVGSNPVVTVGASALVSGRVDEFRPGSATGNNLTITEITSATWEPGAPGDVQPTVIGLGGRFAPIFTIDDDAVGGNAEDPATPFDPSNDGLDFHESLEGMLVRVRNPVAVGPTNDFGELPVVGDFGFLAFPHTLRGGLFVRPDDFNPERIILDGEAGFPAPDAHVRDRLGTLQAVVHYSFGNFKYFLTATPALDPSGLKREVTQAPKGNELAAASMNVENLDPTDPPAKFEQLAKILVDNMRSPDLVAIEEVQDNNGAAAGGTDASLTYATFIAAIQAVGGPTYDFRQINPAPGNQDGGEPNGNIRVGFLFRTDRGLSFVDRPGGDATTPTTVVDTPGGAQLSLSPGRIDPTNPAFNNSRKPLAGEFRWKGRTVFAIANHFNSKGGDDPLFGRFQPPTRVTDAQRHQQAAVVAGFIEDLLAADEDAKAIVLGDLNDFEFSETLDILEDGGLFNLMETLPVWERYSYVFDGNSQTLDQILVTKALMSPKPEYDSVHVNAEFHDQASDHDPQVARLKVN
jgi:predicted extracellular nuclease